MNLLLVFPVDALYALADRRADRHAQEIFNLILALVDRQYQVDVCSPEEIQKGRWQGDSLCLHGHVYEAVILPWMSVVEDPTLRLLAKAPGANGGKKQVVLFGAPPEWVLERGRARHLRSLRATLTTGAGSLAAIFLAQSLLHRFSGKGLVPDALTLQPEFLLAVALGAFGAHGLKDVLSRNATAPIWEKAVLYHFIHAVMLFVLGSRKPLLRGSWFCFLIGIVFFSGSLYLLAVSNVHWLGAVTPIGGVSFLAGWFWLLMDARKLSD